MAKRFTSTEKWGKTWFRKLSIPHKCFWIYLLDRSNHAGIWDVDFELAEFCIGEKLDPTEIKKVFSARIKEIDEGKKWFVIGFVEFQYGELNPASKPHKSVIKILIKEGVSEGLVKGSVTIKDKAKDKDKDKDKGGAVGIPEDTGKFGTDFYNLYIVCFRKRPNPVQEQDAGKLKRKYGWEKLKAAMAAMRSGGYGWGIDGANVEKWCKGEWDKPREKSTARAGRRDRVYKGKGGK